MRILYIATARMPTEKAHGIQIMKMCEAFAALGHTVELIVPFRRNDITTDPFIYYGVARTFKITTLLVPDLILFGRIGFSLHRFLFGFQVRRYAKKNRCDVLYSRDEVPLWCLGSTDGIRVFEAHEGRWTSVARAVLKRADRIIVITRGLRDFFTKHGVPAEKISVLPDGVEYETFASAPATSTIRTTFGISEREPIVLYTGHLYAWKGADILAKAAAHMPNTHITFVGGTESDLKRFRAEYGEMRNIHILGHRPYREIPGLLAAADVLVIPNSAREDISRLYTSPMKLFEYMAVGKPIVASDLPSIREVLDEKTALFFKPDDPFDLVRAIEDTLRDKVSAERRAVVAQERAKEYSWHTRAEKVLTSLDA